MEREKAKNVSSEEMEFQRGIMENIKSINERHCLQSGSRLQAFIQTYGCQQNESDSERLKGMLSAMGYDFCDDFQCADLVIYNTCAVRENAELRVFGNIGALKAVKLRRPRMLIGVCGCMMQQEHIAETIKKKYKHVDMVFGTHALYKFPQILENAMSNERVFFVQSEDGSIAENIPLKRGEIPLANVPVMYGCNNFCTYCIVPYVRGRERSRSGKAILDEVNTLAGEGYKEVMLLGQNVNSYGNDLTDSLTFAELLKEIAKIDGIERIRFITSHPKDISDELIETIAICDKICKQLHLPIQAGSDRILSAMNRKYTKGAYLEIIKKLRDKVPKIVLSTDIIVGFPGETMDDFEETLSVLKEVRYDMVYSFIYSKRVGTPAAAMEDVLSEDEKHANFDRMLEIQNDISNQKNQEYVGTVQKVLVEGFSKSNADMLTGRTDGGKIAIFEGNGELKGEIVRLQITRANTWTLYGNII